eukprot:1043191-Pelagomonas_calceolata.AAC.2
MGHQTACNASNLAQHHRVWETKKVGWQCLKAASISAELHAAGLQADLHTVGLKAAGVSAGLYEAGLQADLHADQKAVPKRPLQQTNTHTCAFVPLSATDESTSAPADFRNADLHKF